MLRERIPITRAMDVRVTVCEPERIVLGAPLEPNFNHKCTAFGGSLYSVAVLSGWALILATMERAGLDGEIVIASSTMAYHSPVTQAFEACCRSPSAEAVERFLRMCAKKGRARIALDSQVQCNGIVACEFSGTYAVTRSRLMFEASR